VTFTNITNDKWFKIYWSDGSTSMHDSRFLVRLEIINEDDSPEDLIRKPEPIVIMIARQENTWSLQTAKDIKARLCASMPGNHDEASIDTIFRSLNAKVRKAMTVQTPPSYVHMLTSTLQLDTCKVILDPWAGNKAIEKGLHVENAKLCLNDKLQRKGVHLHWEPLEAALYHFVIKAYGQLNAIVMAPPVSLCDLAFINALEFAGQVVCMLVPDVWVVCAHEARRSLLNQLERESRLLIICDVNPACNHYWVCVFSSPTERSRLLHKDLRHHEASRVFMKTVKS
jgi:hypothetical protein